MAEWQLLSYLFQAWSRDSDREQRKSGPGWGPGSRFGDWALASMHTWDSFKREHQKELWIGKKT